MVDVAERLPDGRPDVETPAGEGPVHARATRMAMTARNLTEARSVVITGASRGLGFASAKHLYRQGWRVVAAMRSPETGLALLREATGAPRMTTG